MITELLKLKLGDLSFDLAAQKCLAIGQASKDVQLLQGEQMPGTSVNKLDTNKFGEDQASAKSTQKTQGSWGKGSMQSKPYSHCTKYHNKVAIY